MKISRETLLQEAITKAKRVESALLPMQPLNDVEFQGLIDLHVVLGRLRAKNRIALLNSIKASEGGLTNRN